MRKRQYQKCFRWSARRLQSVHVHLCCRNDLLQCVHQVSERDVTRAVDLSNKRGMSDPQSQVLHHTIGLKKVTILQQLKSVIEGNQMAAGDETQLKCECEECSKCDCGSGMSSTLPSRDQACWVSGSRTKNGLLVGCSRHCQFCKVHKLEEEECFHCFQSTSEYSLGVRTEFPPAADVSHGGGVCDSFGS